MFRNFFSALHESLTPVSWGVLGAWVLLIVLGVLSFTPAASNELRASSPYLWLMLSVIGLGFLATTIRLARRDDLGYLSALVFILVLTSLAAVTIALLQLGHEKHIRRAFELAAMIMVGFGWFVTFKVSSKTQRKQHTLNVLTQSRLSTAYMENVKALDKVAPFPSQIPEFLADCIKNLTFDESDTPKKRNYEAALATRYLLNYFEYLSAGMRQGDLDARLIYETVGGIMASLYDRTKGYRAKINSDQPEAFEHLEYVTKNFRRWRADKNAPRVLKD